MQRNATTPRNATHALVQRNTTEMTDYGTQCSRTRKVRQHNTTYQHIAT